MENIIELINGVGFPILACLYLAKLNKDLSTSIAQLNQTLTSIDIRLQRLEKEQNL